MSLKIQDINPNISARNEQLSKLAGSDNANARKVLAESEKLGNEFVRHLSKPMDRTFLTPVKDMIKKLNIF